MDFLWPVFSRIGINPSLLRENTNKKNTFSHILCSANHLLRVATLHKFSRNNIFFTVLMKLREVNLGKSASYEIGSID